MSIIRRPFLSLTMKARVRKKCGGRCGYCGLLTERIHIDHMEPFAKVREHKEENLMPSCHACNNLKNIHNVEAFRKEIAAQLGRARMYSVNYRTALRFNQVTENPSPIKFYFEKLESEGN